MAVWYRDYDGVWTMPVVTAANVASNTLAACAVSLQKTSGTWDGYEQFGPLKLATKHQFGERQINFSDVKVEAE